MTTLQYDFVPINKGKIESVAGGGIRVKGVLASVGWLQYQMPDGNIELQYVPETTLFNTDHLQSLEGMAVTLYHPVEGSVNPTNYQKLTVGTVLNVTPNANAQTLDAILSINEMHSIDAVVNGAITDLSCGYSVEKELIKGNEYRQTKRVANHVSLVPEGRDKKAGLNLDSATLIVKPKLVFLGRF